MIIDSRGNQRDHRARAAFDERAETHRQYGMTAPSRSQVF